MFICFCYTPNLKLASLSIPFFYFFPLSFSLFIFLTLKSPLFQTHSPIFCSAGWCHCVTSPSNPSTLSYHHPSLSFSPSIWCPWFPCFPSFPLCTVSAFLLLSHRLCRGRVMSPPRWPHVGGFGQLLLEMLWEHRVSRQCARVLSQAHGLASFLGIIDIVLFNIHPRRAQTRSERSLAQRGSEGEVKLRSIWSWPGEAAAERYDTSSWKQKNCCVRETSHSVLCWAPPGAWWALESSFRVIFKGFLSLLLPPLCRVFPPFPYLIYCLSVCFKSLSHMDFSLLTHLPPPSSDSQESSVVMELGEEQPCSRHRASAAGSFPPSFSSLSVLCC